MRGSKLWQRNWKGSGDPVVDDFFRAELAFCRMMQEVNLRVTEAIDFDMEFPL